MFPASCPSSFMDLLSASAASRLAVMSVWGVDVHGDGAVGVARQRLHDLGVHARPCQRRGVGVPKFVQAEVLRAQADLSRRHHFSSMSGCTRVPASVTIMGSRPPVPAFRLAWASRWVFRASSASSVSGSDLLSAAVFVDLRYGQHRCARMT